MDVLGGIAPEDVRVRFPPSPTGNLHVGNVRSALFNYAFARHYGGTLVLRIEDTDVARSTEEYYDNVIDSLKWLGITWDEGPDIGGPYGPYRQSQRTEIYQQVIAQLVESGAAYPCYCTREEQEQREAARGGDTIGYDGHCRTLSAAQIEAYEAEGRTHVLRIRMPEGEVAFDDLVRGHVAFDTRHVPDYAIVRSNGEPLYTLVNPVDDALMGITHVLRGEDLLSSTPRQIVLYEALARIGVGSGITPRFGHLPIVMGEGNKRLSKRDKGSGLEEYRERGFLPEGLMNYLALLGWSISDDRDVFTMAEMAEAFDIRRVNANAARFDHKKCEAINAAHIRLLSAEDLAAQITPFLQGAGFVATPATPAEKRLLVGAAPLIQERLTCLSDAVEKLAFLFTADEELEIEPAAALKPDEEAVLLASRNALVDADWDHDSIEAALRSALVDDLGLKPRKAFGPLRTAVTGSKVSPPLFESMELLGRESSLVRIDRALASVTKA
ncbi:glutamate--tRNA ligase [Raineyella fluvialis]|uniref:Glutamate--tRNA ligase n=1 Tax=Raineyella fluvialis TaxID=2662261 RepID=A0A5Q2FHT9_9ACTN|nr:glutamate--tRNA ligase [Raineyella fluvialis]QGF25287.1 glutamate--tRNA ligase [Raineyella fluvialis]